MYSEFLFALDFSNNKVEEVSLKSLYNSTNELTNEDESKAVVFDYQTETKTKTILMIRQAFYLIENYLNVFSVTIP